MDHTNVAYGQTATSHWLASPLLWLFFVLGVIAWTIIAVGIVLEKADTMDRSERIAQLYGYTVCLIAIIVFIFSANDLISSAFEYANPLASGAYGYGYNGQNLTSFETYKATYQVTSPGEKRPPALSDSDLRAQYEALRDAHIASARFDAARSLTTSAILIVIAIVLFVTHWRWLRTRARASAT